MLSIIQFTKKVFSHIRLSKKRYQYYSEAIRELGSGLMIAFALTLFFDDRVILHKIIAGVIISFSLWYIGSSLFERS